MTVLRRLSVLLLALCCCACSTGDAADVPQATPIPTPQVLEGLRRNEEGIPLLDVYLHEEETIRSMDIERYVCGVLAGEMRNDWPLEALKAQAILARTFVLKFVSEKESRYEGADISTDITEAQAYNAAEINERIEQAVAETCGQVLLTASGELPYAWFHAHSGGKTALAREGLGWNDPETHLHPRDRWPGQSRRTRRGRCLERCFPGQAVSARLPRHRGRYGNRGRSHHR